MGQQLGNAVKEIIQDKKISVLQLAKEVDVDRTTLQHFFTGKRKIQLETFQQIMKVLDLTKEEKKILYILYEKESNDKDVIKNAQDILSLYRELSEHANLNRKNIRTVEYSIKHDFFDEKSQIIKGQIEIEALIRSCFIEEMERSEKAHVIMSVNFRHQFLYDLIIRVASGQNKCGKIQNIFPFVNKKKLGNNLDILKNVLQLKCLEKIDYEPYYFYSGTKIYDDISIIVPNYFITSKYVIAIERNFESALISEKPQIIQYYREKAESIINRCEQLVKKKAANYDVESIPVFEMTAGVDGSIKFYAFEQIRQWQNDLINQTVKNKSSPLIAWESKSLNFVIREGFLTEFGTLGIRFVDNPEMVEFLMLDDNGKNTVTLSVDEPGITSVFRDFFDYLPKSFYIYRQDELERDSIKLGDTANN